MRIKLRQKKLAMFLRAQSLAHWIAGVDNGIGTYASLLRDADIDLAAEHKKFWEDDDG